MHLGTWKLLVAQRSHNVQRRICPIQSPPAPRRSTVTKTELRCSDPQVTVSVIGEYMSEISNIVK